MVKINNYFKFNRDELVDIFVNNNETQPKAKTSNNIIIRLLDNCTNEFTLTCELTRGGCVPNRGSVIECILNHLITHKANVVKANFEESDLTTKKLARKYLKMLELAQSKNIEIKFATGYAYATQVTSNARFIILVTPYGIWLMKPKNIVYTKNMKIKASEQNYELATRLVELEQYIGY